MDKIIIDDFINNIIKKLEGIKIGSNIAERTVSIKKALIEVTEEEGLYTNCKLDEVYRDHENYEWVYDIISYSMIEDNILDKVYLVCESEWNSDYKQIKYDFEKLIFARAKVRLIVYQVSSDNYNEYINNFINIIKKSSSCEDGDIYLFAVYVYNNNSDNLIVKKVIKSEK